MAKPVPFSRNNSTPDSDTPVSITLKPLDVWVAPCTANSDPTKPPTWGSFEKQPSLQVDTLYFGSTLGGMSTAALRLAPGQPIDGKTDRVEGIDPLGHGDRVIIAMGDEPRWAGYCVGGAITIDVQHEGISYRLVGPEWIWGEDGQNGAINPVFGQVRMQWFADDIVSHGGAAPSSSSALTLVTDEQTVFNPHGRKNMGAIDVPINTADNTIKGKIFETPDRVGHANVSAGSWTQFDAVKLLFNWFNDPAQTGINMNSSSWTTVAGQLDTTTPIRETSVDGMGLWGAIKSVLSPDWGAYVDPVPSDINTFSGFSLGFFQRGSGSMASFTLNALGTSVTSAAPSVSRLQAEKDTAKSVNKVTILGKATRHIQLQYFGGHTPATSGAEKAIMLQHGWGQSEGKLSDYAANDAASGFSVVTEETIASKGSSSLSTWNTQFNASGAQFTQYAHVFRFFTWNEAGELQPNSSSRGKPVYDSSNTPLDWLTPYLDGIADDTGFIGASQHTYVRRRRKLLDTQYPDPTQESGWRRVPPTLYLSAIGTNTSNQSIWVRAHAGTYRIDHERAGIWITVPDIATWKPFAKVADPDEASLDDDRTFATLLHTGKLRMLLEGSIDVDFALTALADRQATAGSPLVRSAVFRQDHRFVQSLAFTNAATISTPSSLTSSPVDDSSDAVTLAQRARAAGERQQVHASVLAEPDWPEQTIGTIINGTDGRKINLQGGANNTGAGAQIVGKAIHVDLMKWEYVTESRAAKLHDRHRQARAKKFGSNSRGGVSGGGSWH